MQPLILRAAGVALILDASGPGIPRVRHWGADPGEAVPGADELAAGVAHSGLDQPWPFTLLPGQPEGWSGRPALTGSPVGGVPGGVAGRGGSGPAIPEPFPRWRQGAPAALTTEPGGAQRLEIDAEATGLAVRIEIRMEPTGLLRIRHVVTNTSPVPFRLDHAHVVLPVPEKAVELLDLTGRWCRERSPQRFDLGFGVWSRECRRGRTGHDAPLLMACGTAGFGFRQGELWAVHVAWSGNQVHYAERLPEGAGGHAGPVLGGGELLDPGELDLAPGASHTTPWVLFAYGRNGIDEVSARVHGWLRARAGHPNPVTRPRPLVLNTWEAVYMDHELDRLTELARVAASVGVERFVLDDGWFGGRRHDRAGLGDWYVSPEVWPQGLRPLADVVRGLGMEFGLWFEPEMVNLDSDLVRAHPEWLLGPGPATGRDPARAWRHQYLLDLARPDAFDHVLERLDTLVGEIGVDFVKWDHNRDLHEAPAHAQTEALYRLLDELRVRHPGLEIESCASGGGRIDLGILARTDRVWASDTIDALERQQIQRWTSVLMPPELIGSHLAGPRSHTTGRVIDLSMRAVTALFAHAGIEWDLTTCTPGELDQVAAWAALYKEVRPLLHTGTVVRADVVGSAAVGRPGHRDDPDCLLHGVVSTDAAEALFAYVRLRTSPSANPGALRLPGLDPARRYRVRRRDEAGLPRGQAIRQPAWWELGEVEATGAALAELGLPAPMLDPAQAALLHLTPA